MILIFESESKNLQHCHQSKGLNLKNVFIIDLMMILYLILLDLLTKMMSSIFRQKDDCLYFDD